MPNPVRPRRRGAWRLDSSHIYGRSLPRRIAGSVSNLRIVLLATKAHVYASPFGVCLRDPTGRFACLPPRHQPKGKIYNTAGQLGPPPLEHAIQTNRMSPPGVVMTYAADNAETALAETADKPGTFAVGTFVTERDALILDLTRLPRPPSVFAEPPDSLEYDPRLQLWRISKE